MLTTTREARPHPIRHTILQGESEVSGNPALVLSTVLGSCIACCLHDPFAGVGGMNHFLLPTPPEARAGRNDEAERYGLYAMEVLINGMLAQGATRPTMRARLFGGANLHSGMRAIGSENARFAREFLRADGIALADADVGGTQARRVEFQPASGRLRSRQVAGANPERQRHIPKPTSTGDVELF